MHLIDGKCQSCLCSVFFTSTAAATMVALAIFRTLSGAICEGGFPTVISLRGRQHFWICSFLVSTVWRSQHKISEYLVDGISSALKKLSLYFTQRCALWILGLPGKKWICQNFQKSRCLAENGAVQLACLTASFVFFFVVVCFCCFLLVKNVLHFFSELKLCQSVISIMRGKIWDSSSVKEMKMENKNLAKNPYS